VLFSSAAAFSACNALSISRRKMTREARNAATASAIRKSIALIAPLDVSITAERPRILLMTYSAATACFWLRPMSMRRWWMCPRSGAIGFCPWARRRMMAKSVSNIGRPRIRNGTANDTMA